MISEQKAKVNPDRNLRLDDKALPAPRSRRQVLFALDQYGRVHGAVRLRWGFPDERIPAPWVPRDEPTLWQWKDRAFERGLPLEIVTGSAPGWADPWAHAQRVHGRKSTAGWHVWLVYDDGSIVEEDEVQLARLVEPGSPGRIRDDEIRDEHLRDE